MAVKKRIIISKKEDLRRLILEEKDLSKYDYSSITDMSGLLYRCSKITKIPQLDTSNVTNMEEMFYRCERLITIPEMNTSKVTNMNRMFSNTKYIYPEIKKWANHFSKINVSVERMFNGGEIMYKNFGEIGSATVLKSKGMINDFEIKALGRESIEAVLISRLEELLKGEGSYIRLVGKKITK